MADNEKSGAERASDEISEQAGVGEDGRVAQDAAVAMAKDLAAKEAEVQSLYDQLIRLKAEFENYRKRVDREKPELVRYGRGQIVQALLPLYDTLLSAQTEMDKSASAAELRRGLELIFKEFEKLFKAEGLEPIESVGKPYDFEQHEVLGQTESGEHPEGTVVEEIQRGYLLGGKVLRAAKVRVAKAAVRK